MIQNNALQIKGKLKTVIIIVIEVTILFILVYIAANLLRTKTSKLNIEADRTFVNFQGQEFQLKSLWKTLQTYHYVVGNYPENLKELLITSKELSIYCSSDDRNPSDIPSIVEPNKINCGNFDWDYALTVETNLEEEVDSWYSKLPYTYEVNQNKQDFQLEYIMKHYSCSNPDCRSMENREKKAYVNGNNKATRDYLSEQTKTTWKYYFITEYEKLETAQKPENFIPILTNIKAQVYSQNLENGNLNTFVTLTWNSDIETAPTIAFGHNSQQIHQDNYRGEGKHYQKDHRIDFNLAGSGPIHYVLRYCSERLGQFGDFNQLCIRTIDSVIDTTVQSVSTSPETITNSPIISDIQYNKVGLSTTIKWNTHPASVARISCHKKMQPDTSEGVGANYVLPDKTSFSETFSLTSGETYSCIIDAFDSFNMGTLSFPFDIPNI